MPLDEEEFVEYDPFESERQSRPNVRQPFPVHRELKGFTPLESLDPITNYYYRAPEAAANNQLQTRDGEIDNRLYLRWNYFRRPPQGDQAEQVDLNAIQRQQVNYANNIGSRPAPTPDAPMLKFNADEFYRDYDRFNTLGCSEYNMLSALGSFSKTPQQVLDSLPNNIINYIIQRRITDEEREAGIEIDGSVIFNVSDIFFRNLSFGDVFIRQIRESGLPEAENFAILLDRDGSVTPNGILTPNQRNTIPNPPGPDVEILRPAMLGDVIRLYIEKFQPSGNLTQHRIDMVFVRALKAFLRAVNISYNIDFTFDFEFYDFKTEAPFLVDFASFWAINGIIDRRDDQGTNVQFTEDAATIKPSYNYHSPEYERSIRNIPESTLPNMYVYSFISDRENGTAPPWQNSETEEAQIKNNYDKVIRIGEFVSGTLPRIDSPQFRNYLRQYAQGVQNAVVDFSSPAALAYYEARDNISNELISPASEMGFYDKLNYRKNMFPMYTELNIPTLNIGSLGRLIEKTKSSTSCTNALITAPHQNANMAFMTDLFTTPGAAAPGSGQDYDNYVYSVYSDFDTQRQALRDSYETSGFWEQNIKIYETEDWLAALNDDIEAQTVSEEGGERLASQCPGLVDRIRARSISDYIESESKRKVLEYEEYLNSIILTQDQNLSKRGFCKTETLVYKLVKLNANGDLIQNFYFPNTSKEDIIKFVDTQVKPGWHGAKYQYELYAYAVVYGSKFRFRFEDENLDALSGRIYSNFNVETLPNPKIVEYPIFSRLQGTLGFGVSYPPVFISHRPPTSPEMRITPYKGNYRQVLLNFEIGTGEFLGKDSIPYTMMTDKDFDEDLGFKTNAIYQKKFLNYSLQFPKLEFKSEGGTDVTRIEVYRTEELPDGIQNKNVLYKAFGESPYKVLDISNNGELPPEERAKAFDFIDNLNPNRKYYYTCRAKDEAGNFSNPSEIYEVELVYNDGIYYPIIKLYEPKLSDTKKTEKKFIQYLEIKPAEIQTHVETQLNQETNTLTSRKGLMQTDVQSKKFLVRITSRDTGRKFDINLAFLKKDNQGN